MYIYGKNVAKEKLKSNDVINSVYLTNNFDDKDILSLIKERKINPSYIDKLKMNKLVNGLHQGIVLEINDYKTYNLDETTSNIDKKYPLIVMLDHLEDPHNFGSIIRSSECLGVDAIIIPNDRSVDITSTVIKTSAGAIEHIKIIKVSNLVNTINYLKEKGYWIIGTDMDGLDTNTVDYNMPICLVMGNEGKGLSPLIKKNCDIIAKINMTGQTESLNVSVSLGIMLFSINKGRS